MEHTNTVTGQATATVSSRVGDSAMEKSEGAFKTISETANLLGVPQHVLRFWESRFRQVRPLKLKGGRRYYRPEDIEILLHIQTLLYKQGYTIKGARKAIEQEKRNKLGKIAQAIPEALHEEEEAADMAADERLAMSADAQELDVIRNDLLSMRRMLQDAMKD